jgi:hypothetical protein
VDVPVTSAEYHARAVDCDEWRANAVARILALRPPLVVIANYSRNVGADHEGRPIVTPASDWQAGLSALLSRLSTGRIATLILLDNPAATQDVPTCVSRALHEGRSAAACGFSVTAATRRDLGFYAAERAAAAAFADASVLDMTPFICPAERCDIAPHAVPRYRDRHHLTATFSRSLAPRIHDHLARWAADSPGSPVSALLAATVR